MKSELPAPSSLPDRNTMRMQLFVLALAVTGFGCGGRESAVQTPMSDADDPYAEYRVLAESSVLRTIGELDAAAEARVMAACAGAPYQNADEAIDEFEASESLTVAHVEWMQETWRSRKAEDPDANPQAFAAEVANDVYSEIEF